MQARKGAPMAERVALITGGAKGIGRGIALDLAAQCAAWVTRKR